MGEGSKSHGFYIDVVECSPNIHSVDFQKLAMHIFFYVIKSKNSVKLHFLLHKVIHLPTGITIQSNTHKVICTHLKNFKGDFDSITFAAYSVISLYLLRCSFIVLKTLRSVSRDIHIFVLVFFDILFVNIKFSFPKSP